MKICPISGINSYSTSSVKRAAKNNVASSAQNQPTFNGWKGTGIGAGAGLLWSGAIVAMVAVGAPYLLPFAGKAIAMGIGAGALAGHGIEDELKHKD